MEEPDDHLFVKPTFTECEDVTAVRPEWDEEACTACGRCREACNYNAVALVPLKGGGKNVRIFPDLCHACGACSYVCPEDALTDRPEAIGTVEADPASGPYYFAHGMLNVGEMMAPAVVKGVRRHENRDGVTIIDASPGTACPVVAAMEGADVALLVTEPTPFGLNDLHLLLNPDIQDVGNFYGGQEATIDPETCTGCGTCAELCRFNAIEPAGTDEHGEPETYRVKEFACEGCGLCALACPVDAVDMHDVCTGQSYVSETDYGLLSHTRLGIAEENSGRLVTRVRDRASDLVVERGGSRVLGDGSPSTGCPVIVSISGVDVALVVAEPTVSGVHNMERVLELCEHFGVRALV